MSLEVETPTEENKETMTDVARINFGKWKESLQTKDPEHVADLYSKDVTFLPTVSPEFKIGKNGAEEYFTHFLEKDPSGEIIEEEVQQLGIDQYIHSGMYNFEVGPKDNRQIVEARFTMVWAKNDAGEWEILHHHSSVKPKNDYI